MEAQTISLEDFEMKSHSRSQTAFKNDFEAEALKIVGDNSGNCIAICSIQEAMDNYSGKSKAQPSKIVATFFISVLKKAGYKDASKNRVSVSNGLINLRLN